MNNEPRKRKSYDKRALVIRTTSRRFQAGTRRNKKARTVGSFASDKAVA